ncbi:MAG: hypothetical protein ABIG44_01220 [Planctomycetota bacterium]
MTGFRRLALLSVGALLLMPTAAWAQYPSEVVGFNGPPIDEDGAHEMFQIPQWSGSTDTFVIPNTSGFDQNNAFRTGGWFSEGVASLDVFWHWVDNADPDAWMRLTTHNAAERPNPALDTQGKVRFKLYNKSDLWSGNLGVCLAIRETGVVVPQLYDGGVTGDLEFVGVNDSTLTLIKAGPDGVITSTLGGDDLIVDLDPDEIGEDLVISWGDNRQIESTLDAVNDEGHYGVYCTPDGGIVPIPAIQLPPRAISPYVLEWNLLTGEVTVDGGAAVGGIAGFTGNGVLDVVPNRGTLDCIAFVNDPADTAAILDVFIDELQFEATEPDPVVPPTVVWPIINGDDQITVTDIQTGADLVELWVQEEPDPPELVEQIAADPPNDAVFTLSPTAQTDQIYYARQHVPDSDVWSELSDGVTVLPFPPVMTFSLLVDEGGLGSCSPILDWEFVAVTQAASWNPLGTLLFADDGVWQTIDIPLNDDDLVLNGYLGDGILGPSPNGYYTIDTVWFTFPQAGQLGPWHVLLDSMQVIDEFGQPGEMLMDFEDGEVHFRYPRGQSPDQNYDVSARTEAASYDGVASHRFVWSYDGVGTESISFLQRSAGCGTSVLIPDDAAGLRFRMCIRNIPSAPEVPLPEVVGPIIVGTQDTVRVLCDPTATTVYLYINGEEIASATPADGYADFAGLLLETGYSVSAIQILPAQPASDLAYPRGASDTVPSPTVESPIIPGATTVTVNGLMTAPYASADLVTVIVRDDLGQLVGTYPETPTGDTVDVLIDAVLEGYQISATQTVNGVESLESDIVVAEFVIPVMHHVPAEGDTEIKVLDAYDTGIATITLRDLGGVVVDTFSGSPDPGETSVIIPVSGLLQGYTVTVYQTVEGSDTSESPADTVTIPTTSVYFSDTMEIYTDQAHYENDKDWVTGVPIEYNDYGWWPSSGDPGLTLDFTKNTTLGAPGGGKCAYSPAGESPPTHPGDYQPPNWQNGWQSNHDYNWRENPIPPVGPPTNIEPIVWTVAIYDTEGAGFNNMYQWAELRDYSAGFGGLVALTIPGTSFFTGVDNNYYSIRALVGYSGSYHNMNQHEAPMRSVGWHMFTVVIKESTLDAYVDGKLAMRNLPYSGTDMVYDNMYMGSGYAPGADAYYDDFFVELGAVIFHDMEPQAPPEPSLVSPLEEGALTVTVTDIVPDAILVTVYDATTTLPIGSIDPDGADTIDVPVDALVHLQSIVATQTNATDESGDSDPLEVGKGSGDILICIGVRETTDVGDLGQPGQNSGEIEWVGATSVLDNAPQGTPISATGGWQTLEFDPAGVLIEPFTGDGAITAPYGTLEHLAVAVNSTSADRSTGVYHLYVDNVINVGAGAGGSNFVIEDFEAYALDSEVLFQEPTFSGTTDIHLSYPPSYSGTTDAYGNPGQSEYLSWFWLDTTAQRWIRLTSYLANNRPSPIIDLSKPIRMDVLLIEEPQTAVCCYGYYCEAWSPSDQAGCEDEANGWGVFIPDVTCADIPCDCGGQNYRGDSNCDTLGPNSYDIDGFIQAVSPAGQAQWILDHPTCDLYCANDINCDGAVNSYDIDGFINCVGAGVCDPCP